MGEVKLNTRRRSLLKDKSDMNAFRHHRDRHLGVAISNEYYQQAPLFFTRECAQLNLIGQYKGASAFLICNGPSLVSGDYDLAQLHRPGVMTYGVNNGPSTFRPNFWSCVDDPSRFLKSIWLDPKIQKFVPQAHAEKPIFDNETWKEMKDNGNKVLVGECPNVVYFHRNEKFVEDRWLFEDKINWGCHKNYGGCRSVMLPSLRILFLLGFRKVYLLGADFTMTEDYAYHFDEKREKGAVSGNMNTYKRMRDEYFPKLKPYFEDEGFEIYNCNPDSGLGDTFDYCPFKDAIAEATGKLGEVENERTWGMYCKPGDKDKTIKEPGEHEKKHLKTLKEREKLLAQSRPYEVNYAPKAPQKPQKVKVSQEPAIREVPERDEEYADKKPYKVVSVNNEEMTASSQGVVRTINTDTSIKQVKVRPEVERIEEIPKSPSPVSKVPGERKLIKNLPFRS